MNKLMTTGTLGLAGLVTTGLVAWQAPVALADHGSDDQGRDDRGHHSKAFKREDDSQAVVTTVDDDDNDDTGARGDTGTHTRTRGGSTGTHTRGGDHSMGTRTRDHTNDGSGRGNVDHSRHHTNDGTRHDTRG
jgi:hypothetical protein